MCVILACKSSKPSREVIAKCYADNDDGAGIAWFTTIDGQFVNAETLTPEIQLIANYKKGLNEDEIAKLIEELPLPFIVHFRANSVGGRNTLLTHPFEMTEKSELRKEGKCDKLLIHNGTFSDWKICLAAKGLIDPISEPMSDTRAIAMIASNGNDSFIKKINRGKFIVVDSQAQKFRLIGDTFIEESGIYYSNLTWKSKMVHSQNPHSQSSPTGPTNQHFASSSDTRANDLPQESWDAVQTKISQKKKLTDGIVITNVIKDGVVIPKVLSRCHTPKKDLNKLLPLTDDASTEDRLLRLQFFEFDKSWSNNERKVAFKKFCRRNNIPFENWRGWCGIKSIKDDSKIGENGLRFAINAT